MPTPDRDDLDADDSSDTLAAADNPLGDRVRDLEYGVRDVRKALQRGNEAFAEIRTALKPREMDATAKATIATLILSLLCSLGVLIWKTARYPDRDEFKESQTSSALVQGQLHEQIEQLRLAQSKTNGDIEVIKASLDRSERTQESIDAKLDAALGAPHARHP